MSELPRVWSGRSPDTREPVPPALRTAGVEFGDVEALVRADGLESALGRLYDAGVYVTLDEVKGRRPIERHGLSQPITAAAFDNPLMTSHYQGMSSGSRGRRTRVNIDLALLEHGRGIRQPVSDGSISAASHAVWRRSTGGHCGERISVGESWQAARSVVLADTLVLGDCHWKFACFARDRRRGTHPGHGSRPAARSSSASEMCPMLAEIAAGTPGVLDQVTRLCGFAVRERACIDISGTLFHSEENSRRQGSTHSDVGAARLLLLHHRDSFGGRPARARGAR